jgi:hypothetical protein
MNLGLGVSRLEQMFFSSSFKSSVSEFGYSLPVTELLWLEEKRFVQVTCYIINKIPKFWAAVELMIEDEILKNCIKSGCTVNTKQDSYILIEAYMMLVPFYVKH